MKTLLEDVQEHFGTRPFTTADLLESPIRPERHSVQVEYAMGREGGSVARTVGRLLQATDGIEPIGMARSHCRLWRARPA